MAGDFSDIDLGDTTIEPTDEQLEFIGQKFGESIKPLPAETPLIKPTDPAVWNKRMAKAMDEARKVYGRIAKANSCDTD